MSETPVEVHARMKEAAHIAGYGFRRARDELLWLLEDGRWGALGFKDGSEFVRSVKTTFSEFRISEDDRSALAKKLNTIASQRAIADMMGVNHVTIGNDLRGENSPTGKREHAELVGSPVTDGENSPQWFNDEQIDPAKLAKGRADRKQRDETAERRRSEDMRDAVADAPKADIRHGDFRDVLAEIKDVAAVVTDPPYGKEFLPLLSDLAAWSDRTLAPHGVLAVLFGQTHLAEAYRLLDGCRPYRWTLAYLTPGPAYVSHARKVQSQWKPVLVYGGSARFSDVVNVPVGGGVEKRNHEWEQETAGFQELIERLTKPGDLVVDPFAGSGTTLLAALLAGRNALGAEIEKSHYEMAKKRLGVV